MGRTIYRDIEFGGAIYPDVNALSEAAGVKPATVRRAIRDGRLHRLGVGKPGPEPMTVLIDGVTYPDVDAASEGTGKTRSAVWAAVCAGDPDRLVRPPRWNPARSKPFEIGGMRWPSRRAASRGLGFSNPEYVHMVIKRGSKRGWQRIMAAAMRLREQQDQAKRADAARLDAMDEKRSASC